MTKNARFKSIITEVCQPKALDKLRVKAAKSEKPMPQEGSEEFQENLKLSTLAIFMRGNYSCDIALELALQERDDLHQKNMASLRELTEAFVSEGVPADLALNYREYFAEERNLLIDISPPSKLAEKLSRLQEARRDSLIENGCQRSGERTKQQGMSDDDTCQVCESGDSDEDNLIVYCEGCNVSVHQKCYGIEGDISSRDWFCAQCQAFPKRDKVMKCALCA